MSDIKPGFYFIAMGGGDWTVAERHDGEWFVPGTECAVDIDDSYVGPRIPTPDEMEGWQVVPKELDTAMIEEFEERLTEQGWSADAAGEIDKQDLWGAQLSAAPKPGDV